MNNVLFVRKYKKATNQCPKMHAANVKRTFTSFNMLDFIALQSPKKIGHNSKRRYFNWYRV